MAKATKTTGKKTTKRTTRKRTKASGGGEGKGGAAATTKQDDAGSSPAELPKWKVDTFDRALHVYQDVRDKRNAFEAARTKMNEKKKELEEAQERLEAIFRGCSEDGPLTARMDPEGWRGISIEEALGSKSLAGLIEENTRGIFPTQTVGALQEYLSKMQLTDIPKIGPKKAEEIEDALFRFWKSNPQWTADGEQSSPEDGE